MLVLMNIKALYEHFSPTDGVARTANGHEVSFDGRYYDLRNPLNGDLLTSDGETGTAEVLPDGSYRCSVLTATFVLSADEAKVAVQEA